MWAKSITLALILSVKGIPSVRQNNDVRNITKDFVFENAFRNPKISKSGKIVSSKNNLICEHFELPCSGDNNKCRKNKTCEGENDICYTTWKASDAVKVPPSLDRTTNIENQAAYDVQRMGCMTTDGIHQCQKSCVHANEAPGHGVLYCCCTGKAIKDIGHKCLSYLSIHINFKMLLITLIYRKLL